MNPTRFFVCTLWVMCVLMAVCGAKTFASADQPDIEINDIRSFKIKDKGDHFEVQGRREFQLTYLSERATQSHVTRFSEGLHAKIKNIKAYCRDSRVKGKNIRYEVPTQSDQFFLERLTYVVSYPTDLKQGDQIRYEYKTEFKDISYLPIFPVPNADRIQKFELRFEHPSDVQVDFATHFPRDPIPIEVTRPDAKHTILSIGPISGVEYLPFLHGNSYQALLLPVITQGNKAVTPSMPADFALWYGSLFEFQPTLPAHVTLPIQADLNAATDDLARLEIIYDFVRMNFRYISDVSDGHSLVPLPPAKILDNRYGDCKDRVCLMQAIAAREGIQVISALVGATPGVGFTDRVNFSQFNHVVGASSTPTGLVYFDPTAKYTPFGQLPENDIGQTALILAGAESYLTTIPTPQDPEAGAPAMKIAITVASDELKTGTADITLRHWYREGVAAGLAIERGTELQNFLKVLIGGSFYKLGLYDFEVLDAEGDPVILRAKADLSDFVVSSPTRLYIPQIPFLTVPVDIRERVGDGLALHFSQRHDASLRIRMTAPNYTANPGETMIGEPGGARFTTSLADADSFRFDFTYTFSRHDKLLLGQEREQFLSFATDILDHKKDMFILEKVTP